MTGRMLIRDGCVLTLGARTPNFTRADVVIEDGRVAEVGAGLRARDAELIDAADTIVMPGFVDAHRHAWKSLLRNLGESRSSGDGSTPSGDLGDHHRPEDVYAATLIGLLGAVEAGVTTVVDWSDVSLRDDVLRDDVADAALQAHVDAGLRTVFVQADRDEAQGANDGERTRRDVARLAEASGPTTTIALGTGPTELDRVADRWGVARELGLHVHVHAGHATWAPGVIAEMAGRGLLGQDVTFVHPAGLDEPDLDAVAASGSSVALAPSSEMAGGLGPPPLQRLLDRGIRPGLAVDDERVSPGDLFAQMRATISLQHATYFDLKLAGKSGLPRLMSTRDVIRHATVDGARVAGLGHLTGSLEPGMQADVVVLRTDRANVFPINDPIGAVVWGMDTSNVDWVIVAGNVLMREGVLQADVARARDLATAARGRVAAAAGLAVGAAPGEDG